MSQTAWTPYQQVYHNVFVQTFSKQRRILFLRIMSGDVNISGVYSLIINSEFTAERE